MITLFPHNQLLVDFIKANQPIKMATLFRSFDGAGDDGEAFARRLHYLKKEGWLLVEGRAEAGVWSANSERRPMHSAASVRKPWQVAPKAAKPPAPAASASPAAHAVAAPARINVMLGTYCPPRPPAMRPGSEDHLHLPSLRGNRLVAHVRGYVSY